MKRTPIELRGEVNESCFAKSNRFVRKRLSLGLALRRVTPATDPAALPQPHDDVSNLLYADAGYSGDCDLLR